VFARLWARSTVAGHCQHYNRSSIISPATSTPGAPSPSDVAVGLLAGQVEALRQQYGADEVREKKPNLALTLLSKFWGLSARMPR